MKKILSIILLICMTACLFSCNNGTDGNTNETQTSDNSTSGEDNGDTSSETTEDTTDAEVADISVIADGASDYTLVYYSKSCADEVALAKQLRADMKAATDVELEIKANGMTTKDREIQFGLTNDPQAIDAYNALDYDEYIIKAEGEKIIITAGCTESLTLAAEVFMENFVNSETKEIKIPEDTELLGKLDDFTLPTLESNKWNVFDYEGTNVEYGILLPQNYDPEKTYPYFIYVHGHGYGGNGTQGPNWQSFSAYLNSLGFLQGNGVRDCIIIAPHLKVNQGIESWWSNSFNVIGWGVSDIPYKTTAPSNNLIDLYTIIRKVGDAMKIDESRVYITGASDGGYATWELITRFNDFFTAAIPLCGAGDTSQAKLLKDFPVWFFHGTADPTVNVAAATKMDAALKAAGSTKYIYTPLTGLDHGISTAAYVTSGLWEWLFEQVK